MKQEPGEAEGAADGDGEAAAQQQQQQQQQQRRRREEGAAGVLRVQGQEKLLEQLLEPEPWATAVIRGGRSGGLATCSPLLGLGSALVLLLWRQRTGLGAERHGHLGELPGVGATELSRPTWCCGAGAKNRADGVELWIDWAWAPGHKFVVPSHYLLGRPHCMETLILFYESKTRQQKHKRKEAEAEAAAAGGD